jgi:predicted Ser/Thr protein kinase
MAETTDPNRGSKQRLQALSHEELRVIEEAARFDGCRPEDFTVEQINLMLFEARAFKERLARDT